MFNACLIYCQPRKSVDKRSKEITSPNTKHGIVLLRINMVVKRRGEQELVSSWFLVFVLSYLHKSLGNDPLALSLDL